MQAERMACGQGLTRSDPGLDTGAKGVGQSGRYDPLAGAVRCDLGWDIPLTSWQASRWLTSSLLHQVNPA